MKRFDRGVPLLVLVAVAAIGTMLDARQAAVPADRPVARTDPNSLTAHAQLLEKKTRGRIDVYFAGDSITRRWGATDYPELLANWRQNFFGWNAANFGWGGDTTQNILWRLHNGELDDVQSRRSSSLLAGTNNVGNASARPASTRKRRTSPAASGPSSTSCRAKAPKATIILTAIFPRNDNMAVMPVIDEINRQNRAHSPTARRSASSTSTTGSPMRTGSCRGHDARPASPHDRRDTRSGPTR